MFPSTTIGVNSKEGLHVKWLSDKVPTFVEIIIKSCLIIVLISITTLFVILALTEVIEWIRVYTPL